MVSNTVTKNVNKIKEQVAKGQFAKVKLSCEKLLKKDQGNVDYLHFLGIALFNLSRLDDAIVVLKKANVLSPKKADVCNSLARIYSKTDKQQALLYQKKAVEINPSSAHLSNLATLQSDFNSFDIAILNAKRAVLADESYVDAWKLLCHLLTLDGRFSEAIEKCLQLSNNDPDKYKLLGEVYVSLNDHSNALLTIDALLALVDLPEKFYDFAINTYGVLGEFSKASELFDKTTFKNKERQKIFKLEIKGGSVDEVHYLERSYRKVNHPNFENIELAFSLAEYYKKKDRKQWFSWLDKANMVKQNKDHYLESETLGLFKQAIDTIVNTNLPVSDSESKKTVFVLGMPRSGTTLTESIIGSHSECVACGESGLLQSSFDKINVNELYEHHRRFAFVNKLADFTHNDFNQIAKNYIKKISQLGGSTFKTVDKMPHNFIYTTLLPKIFPNGKFIHIKRNPIANILSIYEQNFKSFHSYGNSLSTLINYYKTYQNYMDISLSQLPDGQVYELIYEDLVNNTEEEVRKLLDYCDLPFEQACLEFNKQKRAVKTASVKQVRQSIYTSSLRPWEGLEEELKEVIVAFPEATK